MCWILICCFPRTAEVEGKCDCVWGMWNVQGEGVPTLEGHNRGTLYTQESDFSIRSWCTADRVLQEGLPVYILSWRIDANSKMFWFWSPLKNVLGVNLWICFSVWEKDWSRVVLIWACGVDLAPEGSQRVLCKQLAIFSSCQLVFSVYWRPGLFVTSVALNILSFIVENNVL